MTTCSFYHDAKGRTYYLPLTTIERYHKDKRPHTQPQGCIKLQTQDKRNVYILNNFKYPEEAQDVFILLGCLPLMEVKFRLDILKFTKISVKQEKVNPSAHFSDKIFLNIFQHLDSSTLAMVSISCRRFKGLKLNPDFNNICKNAIREENQKILEWVVRKGIRCRFESLKAAERGDLLTLETIFNAGVTFDDEILCKLMEYIECVGTGERFKYAQAVILMSGKNTREVKDYVRQIALDTRDREVLRISMRPTSCISDDHQKLIASEDRVDLIKIIVSGFAHQECIYFFEGAAKSGAIKFFEWGLDAIKKGVWKPDDSVDNAVEHALSFATNRKIIDLLTSFR